MEGRMFDQSTSVDPVCLWWAQHVRTHRVTTSHPSPAGLSVDGLYRVSGNLAVIQKLRFAVNHGRSLWVCRLTTNMPTTLAWHLWDMKCALSTHTDVLIHEMQLRYIYDILFSPSPCLICPPPPHIHQMRRLTWMTVSGRTSTSPLEPSRCSSGSFLSLSSHTDPSTTLLMPSVSNCVTGPLLRVQHLCL